MFEELPIFTNLTNLQNNDIKFAQSKYLYSYVYVDKWRLCQQALKQCTTIIYKKKNLKKSK